MVIQFGPIKFPSQAPRSRASVSYGVNQNPREESGFKWEQEHILGQITITLQSRVGDENESDPDQSIGGEDSGDLNG